MPVDDETKEAVVYKLRSRDVTLSPSAVRLQAEHDRRYKWTTCCGKTTDARLLQYCAQLTFGFIVAGFCMVRLSAAKSCEDTTLYSSILSGVIGVFLPGPRGVVKRNNTADS